MDKPLNECILPKFWKRRQEQIGMFFYVQGVRNNLPTVSVKSAIKQFLDFYNIDGDIKCLETEYGRMQRELMDADKG